MKLNILNSKRTNNFNDEKIFKKISSLHETKIENVDGVYVLYHDYESDYKGDYTISIGVKNEEASIFKNVPDNLLFNKYKVKNNDPAFIPETWQKIWKEEDDGKIKRAYDFDFEEYLPSGEITIFISLKRNIESI